MVGTGRAKTHGSCRSMQRNTGMSMGLESQTTVPTVNGLSLNQMAATGTVGHSEKTYRFTSLDACTGGLYCPRLKPAHHNFSRTRRLGLKLRS
jgi:hypothetical protein